MSQDPFAPPQTPNGPQGELAAAAGGAADPFAFLTNEGATVQEFQAVEDQIEGQPGQEPQQTIQQQLYNMQPQDAPPHVPDPQPQQTQPPQQPQQPQQPQETEAERVRREFEAYRQQVEGLNPILQYANQNPELLQQFYGMVEQHLRGGGQPQQAEPEPQPPQAPQRPADYNDADAYSDPQSSSWQYRVAQERYRDEMAEYRYQQLERRNQLLEQQLQQQREADQRTKQEQALYNDAIRRGATPEEAQGFVEFLNKTQVTQDDLWQLYRLRTQGNSQPQIPGSIVPAVPSNVPSNTQATRPNPAQAAQQLQSRNQRLNVPVPSAVASGGQQQMLSPEDQIFNALLAEENRANPWGPPPGRA